MKRTVTRIPIGANQQRIVTRLEGDPCPPESNQQFIQLVELIRSLVANPHLLQCDVTGPASLTFTHNGTRWIAEAIATTGRIDEDFSQNRAEPAGQRGPVGNQGIERVTSGESTPQKAGSTLTEAIAESAARAGSRGSDT